MLQPDTLLNDRYRLDAPIGEGGMATVYRGFDTRLGRPVAIKVLHPEYARDQPFLQRFQQEAEFAASLGAHPSIVAIYDIGQDGGLHYIVMELVEGRNLKDLIEERAPFSVDEAFSIGRQVASALDFAHRRGLIHRDVKPQNILVTDGAVAKVTDFGIARSLAASQLTRTGMVIGTAHYFSPEQAQGKPATPASDIYALGIVLYEMLTGHLPFDADTPIGVAMQHLHSEPPPPWDYNPALSTRAASIVLRALTKDPKQRYRDAAEFASALAAQAGADVGTTTLSPIVTTPRQQTRVQRAVEPPPAVVRRRPVEVARPEAAPPTPAASSPWRRIWLIVGVLLAAAAVAAGAFFVTNRAFGGVVAPTSTPTPTASPTPKPTPVRRRSPTAVPTVPAYVPPVPTNTPYVAPPTDTPRPLPTFTPVPPTPIPTPRPKPAPSPTPVPKVPTNTPEPFPPLTATPIG